MSTDPRSRFGAQQAALRLIAPPPRPTRPPYVPAQRLPRRPGERREPLAITALPSSLTQAVVSRGLELGCAVELCLERVLVRRDFDEHGVGVLYPRLLELAATTEVRRPLPPAKARYLQMLLAARERAPGGGDDGGTGDVTIDVPLRLFPRVYDVLGVPLAATDLDEALVLEVAALSDGRSMSEWAALAALRLSL